MQSADLTNAGSKLDVRTASRHVRGDGDRSRQTRMGHDLSLALMVLRVQDVVRDPLPLQHAADGLGHVYARRADKHGALNSPHLLDFVDDGVILFASRLVHLVVRITTDHGLVGRNDDNVELVNVEEFRSFRFCSSRHARELLVHSEVILERDRGERLRIPFDLHPFLRFDRLMEPFGVPSSGQKPTGELIHDHDLAFLYDVFNVVFVEAIGLQQLQDRVDAVVPFGEEPRDLVLSFLPFFDRKRRVSFDHAEFGGDVRNDKEVFIIPRIVHCQEVPPFFRQVDDVRFFVDAEKQLVVDLVHARGLVLQIDLLGPLHQTLVRRLRKDLQQSLVLGQSTIGAQQQRPGLFLFPFSKEFFRFRKNGANEVLLRPHDAFDVGLHLVEFVVF